MNRIERFEKIKHWRDVSGLKFREIGNLLKISRQRVHRIYHARKPPHIDGYPYKRGGVKTIMWNGIPKRVRT